MAYITYEQYTGLGYSAVPQASFKRWALMAEQTVRRHTFDRITDDNITEANRCGVCEIMDALYGQHQTVSGGESGQPVNSFSNQHYSESYASPEEMQKAADRTVAQTLGIFFTPEQLYRGIE